MEQESKVTFGDDNFFEARRDIIIHGMRMPRTCVECPMQFGGLCFAAPAEVDDTQVAPTVDECEGRAEWCPLELAEDVEMKHYEQGRKDEAAIREGRFMQSFSPD